MASLFFDDDMVGVGTKRLGKGVWFYSEDGVYPGAQGDEKSLPSGG